MVICLDFWSDESAVCDRDLLRTRLRSPRGRRPTRKVTLLNSKRFSLLPEIGVNGALAVEVFEGSINRHRFEKFLMHRLVSFFGSSVFNHASDVNMVPWCGFFSFLA